ncbi:hypothetical protein EV143_12015 [Flavobacterium chryseum]|uniref:hypothetical protein n=1 Tax=Flavobacterium sp. P3160 TaxID=2512113 RepID=UPI0010603A81|nr:hypothetical protein [Flavobacterium sp. P3160]TDO68753.1 hypothetical protein EV143_12015 [Flavobacterium sp. P3160]
MITNEVYLKALEIVNAYHEQVRLEALEIRQIEEFKQVRVYRRLDRENEPQPGDFVKCVFKHSSSKFTLNKEYEIIRIVYDRFEIMNDEGKKKFHNLTTTHFQLI